MTAKETTSEIDATDAITVAERAIVREATYFPVDMAGLASCWRAVLPVPCADPGARLVWTFVQVYQKFAQEADAELYEMGYLFREWLEDLVGEFLTDRDEILSAFSAAMEVVANHAWERCS